MSTLPLVAMGSASGTCAPAPRGHHSPPIARFLAESGAASQPHIPADGTVVVCCVGSFRGRGLPCVGLRTTASPQGAASPAPSVGAARCLGECVSRQVVAPQAPPLRLQEPLRPQPRVGPGVAGHPGAAGPAPPPRLLLPSFLVGKRAPGPCGAAWFLGLCSSAGGSG